MVLPSVTVHQVSRRMEPNGWLGVVSDLMLNGNVLMLKPGGKWEEGRLKDGLACLVGG